MSAREQWRRSVLENPGSYSAAERAEAWTMTARQCRENGCEWAAEIADEEARNAGRSLRLMETR